MSQQDHDKAARRERMRELADQLGQMTKDQREAFAARLPVTTIEGHAITARNTCLLQMQAGEACTVIGGFRQWLAAGRSVRQGETALYILAPAQRPARQGERADARGMTLTFRDVPVFDVSQTMPTADAPVPTDPRAGLEPAGA